MKYFTVKQIADEQNMSKSAMFHRIAKIPNFKKKYVHVHKGRGAMLIDTDGRRALLKLGLHDKNHVMNISPTVLSDLLDENKRLTEALNHEQQLSLNNQKIAENAQKQLHQLKLNPPKQHGIWWKLFH